MFPTHLHGARVLVGESDPSLRSQLHDALWFHGAEVADAATGRELLARLVDEGPFDAVVGDAALALPSCPEIIARARSADLDLAFVVIARPSRSRKWWPSWIASSHCRTASMARSACSSRAPIAGIPTSQRTGHPVRRCASRAPSCARPTTMNGLSTTAAATERRRCAADRRHDAAPTKVLSPRPTCWRSPVPWRALHSDEGREPRQP